MRVTFGDNQSLVEPDKARIRRLVGLLARQEKVKGREVSLVFVDDSYIRELHGRYLGVRKATDVLAFPMREPGGVGLGLDVPWYGEGSPTQGARGSARKAHRAGTRGPDAGQEDLLGEVYVSAQRAIAQARRYRVGLGQEVARLIVHGVLHLLGYRDDDSSSRRAMIRRQEAFLREHRSLASQAARRTRPRED